MEVLNGRYLIEQKPEGIFILFIFMYKKNKYNKHIGVVTVIGTEQTAWSTL